MEEYAECLFDQTRILDRLWLFGIVVSFVIEQELLSDCERRVYDRQAIAAHEASYISDSAAAPFNAIGPAFYTLCSVQEEVPFLPHINISCFKALSFIDIEAPLEDE
jgi:hypothetical protein